MCVRRDIAHGVYIGQRWLHNTRDQSVVVVNIYRKDGSVMVDNDDTGGRYIVPIRVLKDNFYSEVLYIER